jgi:hypothetical protein
MPEYTAVAYQTTTGRVLYDVDLVGSPTWSAALNGTNEAWQLHTPLEDNGDRVKVREWAERWFSSVAIFWDGQGCQAGPITQNPEFGIVNEMPVAIITGKGFWENLNQRTLHNRTWNPTAGITSATADLTITDALPNIAREIVYQSTNWTVRLGSALPVDLPTPVASSSNTHTYHGYETASAGQRLQELTQVENGPDVFFQPYLVMTAGVRYVRHRMLIGNPYLLQGGAPPLFDLGSSTVDIGVAGDSSPMITTSFVKGTGNEAGQLYGYATATDLITKGWPALDFVDSGHSSASDTATLNSWARANIAQYSRKLEQWKPRIALDSEPRFGTYIPGHFGAYVANDHPWVPDGTYISRILGYSGAGTGDDEVPLIEHQIEAIPVTS